MSDLSRRARLKESTAAAHADLERRIGPLETHASYVAYARGLHAFRAPLEGATRVFCRNDHFGAWRPCEIAPLLAQDLDDLGARPLPLGPAPALSRAEAFGVLYVLEGSTLGARLLKVMASKLGFHDLRGARHLGKQAGALENWRALVGLIETAPNLDIDRAAAGANAAFHSAAQAMQKSFAHA